MPPSVTVITSRFKVSPAYSHNSVSAAVSDIGSTNPVTAVLTKTITRQFAIHLIWESDDRLACRQANKVVLVKKAINNIVPGIPISDAILRYVLCVGSK